MSQFELNEGVITRELLEGLSTTRLPLIYDIMDFSIDETTVEVLIDKTLSLSDSIINLISDDTYESIQEAISLSHKKFLISQVLSGQSVDVPSGFNSEVGRVSYGDNGEAINCSHRVLTKNVSSKYLKELLGNEKGEFLLDSWIRNAGVDISNLDVPIDSNPILLLDSYGKHRTVQYKLLDSLGLSVGDELKSTLYCAYLVSKAEKSGLDLSKEPYTWSADSQKAALKSFSPDEIKVLRILREGRIRVVTGALGINNDGMLQAYKYTLDALDKSYMFGDFKQYFPK